MLHALAAFHVLRIAKLPMGDIDAGTLNDIVAAFPQPAEAVKMMGLHLGNCPILFQDVSVKDLADILGAFIFEGEAPWPIFYMPVNRMEGGVGARIADRGYELQLCSCSEFPHAIQVP